jgi:hypothetical protein
VLSVLWSYNPIHDGDIRSFCFLNEVTIFLTSMAIVAFTNLGPTVSIRDMISSYVMFTIVLVMVANLLVITHKVAFASLSYLSKMKLIQQAN